MEYCRFALMDLLRKTYDDMNVYDKARIIPLFCGGIARKSPHIYCWLTMVDWFV